MCIVYLKENDFLFYFILIFLERKKDDYLWSKSFSAPLWAHHRLTHDVFFEFNVYFREPTFWTKYIFDNFNPKHTMCRLIVWSHKMTNTFWSGDIWFVTIKMLLLGIDLNTDLRLISLHFYATGGFCLVPNSR